MRMDIYREIFHSADSTKNTRRDFLSLNKPGPTQGGAPRKSQKTKYLKYTKDTIIKMYQFLSAEK